MALVEAKCKNCGGVLSVDKKKDAMICPYCGSAFVVAEAINNFNTHYIINNSIKAENVFIENSDDIEKRTGFNIINNVLIKYTGANSNVKIPDGVIKIGDKAFSGNEHIQAIEIPSSVDYVGKEAFAKTSIRTLDLSNAKLIDVDCISGCKELEVLKISRRALREKDNRSEKFVNIYREEYAEWNARRTPSYQKVLDKIHNKPCVWTVYPYIAYVGCPKLDKVYIDGHLVEPEDSLAWFFLGSKLGDEAAKIKIERLKKEEEEWVKAKKCKFCGGKLKGFWDPVCTECGKSQLNK